MRAILALLMLVTVTSSAQYYNGPPCIERKAVVGDYPDDFNPDSIEQRSFRYTSPRRNLDGIFQELFVTAYRNKVVPRVGKSVIYIHGGGFFGGSAYGVNQVSGGLLESGYDVWSIEYRTGWVPCNDVTPTERDFCKATTDGIPDYDLPLDSAYYISAAERYLDQDAAAGLRFIARNWKKLGYGDPYFLFGTSAGGVAAQRFGFWTKYRSLCYDEDSLGLEALVINFGGDYAEGATVNTTLPPVPVLYTHNNQDNVAPWSRKNGGDGSYPYTNTNFIKNWGGRDWYDEFSVPSETPRGEFYFWTVCNSGHGLGQSVGFGENNQYDSLFLGQFGLINYFLPKAADDSWGIARRITWSANSATTPEDGGNAQDPAWFPGNTCVCEPCTPPVECP